MLEPGEILHHALQAVETFAAGVRFVAAHHGRPLFGGHCDGAGIGQEIDQDIFGVDEEQVVAGLLEETLALFGRCLPERFDALNAEWFDDGFHYASTSIRVSRPSEKFLVEPSRKFLLTAARLKDGTNRDEPRGTR